MTTQPGFGVGVHPDLPPYLVHFTGRPRTDISPTGTAASAELRMAQILHAGYIQGFQVYGTSGPVVCLSESSPDALAVLFGNGVTWRGAYAPWALLLSRSAAVAAGFLPVWHMNDAELAMTNVLPAMQRDRRVRFVPGQVDWLAEREWRFCWGDTQIAAGNVPAVSLAGLLVGVIVGQQGWCPPPVQVATLSGPQWQYATACHGMLRWLWDGRALRQDGVFDISQQSVLHAAGQP